MALIVQKFGGTSVGSIDRIKNVASIIKAEKDRGNQVVVVVSAMAGETNKLVELTSNFLDESEKNQLKEYDAALATGESVSAALVALALMHLGLKARSWQGWQVPIITDDSYSKGRIVAIDGEKILKSLDMGEIPVITGFQGVFEDKVVTLGRGGSDTSAAAIAAAIGADRCDIYTDVEGVFTADPRIVKNPTKLDKITYSEMLEMASSGAKVLHPRSVEVAEKHRLQMRVLSSFSNSSGTLLISENESIESLRITGVSLMHPISMVDLQIGNSLENLIGEIKKLNISPLQLDVQNNFLVLALSDKDAKLLSSAKDCEIRGGLAKVSIVGYGLQNSVDVLEKIIKVVNEEVVNLQFMTSSETRINLVVDSQNAIKFTKKLHTCFGLDQK